MNANNKVFNSFNWSPSGFRNSSDDKFDSKSNKIVAGTFHFNQKEEKAVPHDFVTPAYLIEVEMNLQEFVENVQHITCVNKLKP